MKVCSGEMPPEHKMEGGQMVRCWLHENLRPEQARPLRPAAEGAAATADEDAT
jgi:hypothetical protein